MGDVWVCDRCGVPETERAVAEHIGLEIDQEVGYQGVTYLCTECMRVLDVKYDRPWGEHTHA
jgi:hypothetical protein